MNESYEFQIPIGDWSNDGHGRCDYYWIKSNQSMQYVRELYFELCKKYNASFDGNGEYKSGARRLKNTVGITEIHACGERRVFNSKSFL